MSRIIILGANGMLGQMVRTYFTRHDYEVNVINTRFEAGNFTDYIKEVNAVEPGVVINCIGVVKQKSNDIAELLWGNSILPLELARSLKSSHLLIQPSTDCVFDGKSFKPYQSGETSNAQDVYGWSKSLAETAVINRKNSLIMRVSIIGPDRNSNKGLLSWFLSNPKKSNLKGFTNHLWNGITTLEWCKKLQDFIPADYEAFNLRKQGLIQLGTESTYSKYEMLQKFQDVFDTDFQITPFQADTSINRCLAPMIISNSLEGQLIELKAFMDSEKL